MLELLLINKYINLMFLAFALRIAKQNNYSKSCISCGSYLDIEQVKFDNLCEYCGSVQDPEWDNSYHDCFIGVDKNSGVDEYE